MQWEPTVSPHGEWQGNLFPSHSVLWWSVCKSASKRWVTVCLEMCVTPETTLLVSSTMTLLLHKTAVVPLYSDLLHSSSSSCSSISCTLSYIHMCILKKKPLKHNQWNSKHLQSFFLTFHWSWRTCHFTICTACQGQEDHCDAQQTHHFLSLSLPLLVFNIKAL